MRYEVLLSLSFLLLNACSVLRPQPTATNREGLGLHLDGRSMYRYRESFRFEGEPNSTYRAAREWVNRTHAGFDEAVTLDDPQRHVLRAIGSFHEPSSETSEYVYYRLHLTVREGVYTVSYDSLAYQAAPTHHVVALEEKLPERTRIHALTVDYIERALADLASVVEGGSGGNRIELDLSRFALMMTDSGFVLVDRDRGSALVDSTWVTGAGDVEAEEIVSPDNFVEAVTSFHVGGRFTGLHLSSYAIQSEGSAQAAAGRDVFLLLDERDGSLRDGQMLTGITRGRGRSMGCWTAHMHRYLLGDVDGDGFTDIGEQREEINCIGEDLTLPEPRGFPLKWHVFTGHDWEYRPELDDALPPSTRALPLRELEKSPVDFVREMMDRG